jgi:hypothetical protein
MLMHLSLVTGVLVAIRTVVSAIATSMYTSILAAEALKYFPQKVISAAVSVRLLNSSLPALFVGLESGNLNAIPGMSLEVLAAVNGAVEDVYVRSYQAVCISALSPLECYSSSQRSLVPMLSNI